MGDITPELLVNAYAQGIFPMSDGADTQDIFWVEPKFRGVFPLDKFHISRSLKRQIRRCEHLVTFDRAFESVLRACTQRQETWINPPIFELYMRLHWRGLGHSVEVWRNEKLIGGVYGVAMRGAFFGESMFSHATGGSKIALAYLIDQLRQADYRLFDTQFITPHLQSLGAREIPRDSYKGLLAHALKVAPKKEWSSFEAPTPDHLLQRMTQIS